MKVRCVIILVVFLAIFSVGAIHRLSFSGQYRGRKAIRVMFYNTENLFHPGIDSLNPDQEFTPSGMRAWYWSRYESKLHRIAKVIISCGGWEPPAVVGLCEIENKKVLFDLCRRSPLEHAGYSFLHHDSPDHRGIDVALLYRPEKIRILHHSTIPVQVQAGDKNYPSRDILYARVLVMNRDTLNIFVNHWPSRRGGKMRSQAARIGASMNLKSVLDTLVVKNILVMGDFNDESKDISIQGIVNQKHSELFIAQALSSHEDVSGSLVHDPGTGNQWYLFDSFLVSESMLSANAGLYSDSTFRIFSPPYLLREQSEGKGLQPFRTYYGYRYQEGFSDHLPVYIDLSTTRR